MPLIFISLLRPRERWRNIVLSTCVCVCVCVRTSVCPRGYLRNHTRDLYYFPVHVAYGRGSVLLRQGDEISRGMGQFWGFFCTTTMHCNTLVANNVMQQQKGPFRRCRVVTGVHRSTARAKCNLRLPCYDCDIAVLYKEAVITAFIIRPCTQPVLLSMNVKCSLLASSRPKRATRGVDFFCFCNRGVPKVGIKGFISPKLPKLDLTTAAEYLANLVNVIMWL